jgi:hypothetical protein
VQKLPTLDMESSHNMQQRFSHLASLLASGASSTARLFDGHQAAGCLVALCSPRCLPPLRHGPLLRLLLVLLEKDGAKLRDLNSYELAQCAAAAAAMQDATRRQQAASPQQQPPPLSLPQQVQQPLQQQLAEGAAGEHPATSASLVVQESSSSSDSDNSGALALLDPLQRFWQLLHDVTLPQLSTFSVDSLALTALSFAAAGRGSTALLLGAGNSGLARPHKWPESPVAVSRMLKALLLSPGTRQEVSRGASAVGFHTVLRGTLAGLRWICAGHDTLAGGANANRQLLKAPLTAVPAAGRSSVMPPAAAEPACSAGRCCCHQQQGLQLGSAGRCSSSFCIPAVLS